MVALKLYKRATRDLPPALDKLVEAHLISKIPADPFDGEPFKFSAERRVIWSVGQGGKNEGVIAEKEDPENPFDEDYELTWRIS